MKLVKMLFCSPVTGEFSMTKTSLVLMNFGGALYFLSIYLFWYIGGKAPEPQVNDFAKGFFGIGSPVSLVTYLGGVVQQRGGLGNVFKGISNGKGEGADDTKGVDNAK